MYELGSLTLRRTAAENDDRRVRIDSSNFFENCEPVHFGHPQVKDRDARMVLAKEVQAFGPLVAE